MALQEPHDQPEVFISYSRLERGDRSDARWRTRHIALDLVDRLETAVNDAGNIAWRDRRMLAPGDRVTEKIDSALLTCAGGVVVIDPDALDQSQWVRWESSILAWRARLQPDLRVVPVFIGAKREELRAHDFAPSRLDDLQAYDVDPAELDPDGKRYSDALDSHVQCIVKALGPLSADDGLVSAWVDEIADCLPQKVESWRAKVERELRHGERLKLTLYPARVVSREMLVADPPRFVRILDVLSRSPNPNVGDLKRHLEPVWVPADAPTGIAEAKERAEGERIVAINAADAATGVDAVRRAVPGVSYQRRLPLTVTERQVPEAIEKAMTEINDQWAYLGPDETAKTLDGCFVIVACDGKPVTELTEIVAALATRFPCLTYVVMLGDGAPSMPLTVELPEESDRTAATFRSMLDLALKAA